MVVRNGRGREKPSRKDDTNMQIQSLNGEFSEKLQIFPSQIRKSFIIAIDYGTTFSAVAYACIRDIDFSGKNHLDLNSIKPNVVTEYPCASTGGNRSHQHEVPTVSIYPKRVSMIDKDEQEYEWGNGVFKAMDRPNSTIPPNTPKFELVKLVLSDEDGTAKEREVLTKLLKENGMMEVKVIADYLRALWIHALRHIANTEGQANIEHCRKDLVLSVPALWNQAAVRTMMAAAKLADLPEPDIVSEPEAAALYVLRERSRSPANDFQVDDAFVVVDLGGGTVDLTAYRFLQKNPFTVEEAARGRGAMCGSSRLNLGFREWFESKLKLQMNKYSKSEFDRLIEDAEAGFELEKRDFTVTDLDDPYIKLFGLKKGRDKVFQEGCVSIPRNEMCGIFDKIIIDKIIPLIQSQILAAHEEAGVALDTVLIKYVILVGGFSASKYLLEKIRSFLASPKIDQCPSYPIEVLHPTEDHETVVARGSVLRSLNKNFVKRRCIRTSYGIKQTEVFKPGVHNDAFKVRDDHENKDVVHDCIQWLIKSGDTIEQNKAPRKMHLYWTLDADFNFKEKSWEECFCELYLSDDTNPEDNKTLEEMKKANHHIEKWDRLEADFSEADISRLPVKGKGKGKKPYYKVLYQLRVIVQGMRTIWELTVPDVEGVKTRVIDVSIASAFKPGEGS